MPPSTIVFRLGTSHAVVWKRNRVGVEYSADMEEKALGMFANYSAIIVEYVSWVRSAHGIAERIGMVGRNRQQ